MLGLGATLGIMPSVREEGNSPLPCCFGHFFAKATRTAQAVQGAHNAARRKEIAERLFADEKTYVQNLTALWATFLQPLKVSSSYPHNDLSLLLLTLTLFEKKPCQTA